MLRWFSKPLSVRQMRLLCASLLAGFALCGALQGLCWGRTQLDAGAALCADTLRLHIRAASDAVADQSAKLRVRDAVLDRATELLTQSEDMADAWARLDTSLPDLEQAASAACGGAYPVRAELGEVEFPLKEYDGFALPAGRYPALRVVIGEGAGRNWWCVVYPPLCTAACTDMEQVAIDAGLSGDDVKLITEEDGYVLRFRAMELWQRLRQWLGK